MPVITQTGAPTDSKSDAVGMGASGETTTNVEAPTAEDGIENTSFAPQPEIVHVSTNVRVILHSVSSTMGAKNSISTIRRVISFSLDCSK